MSPTIRNQAKLASLAAAAVLAFTAFGSGDARAAFNVKDFSCTTDPFGVHVDVSGLGNQNLCVDGSVTLSLDCACVGGGGNCTSDAKKATVPVSSQAGQSVEPKNGRVNTSFTLPISISDGLCTEPQCGSGQDTKLIQLGYLRARKSRDIQGLHDHRARRSALQLRWPAHSRYDNVRPDE
jgi:hypothetical protein